MVSPLAPIDYGPAQQEPNLMDSYLSGRSNYQKTQLNDQAIQQNQQQISQADYEKAVQKLSVIGRLASKAKEYKTIEERQQFAQSLNPDMLKSVGIPPESIMNVPLDDKSLDGLIAQANSVLPQTKTTGEAASFNEMTKNLSETDREKARRVALGLDPRMMGSGAITTAVTPGLSDKVSSSEGSIELSKRNNQNQSDLGYKPQIETAVDKSKAAVELATKPQIERETTAAKTQAEMDTKNAVEGKNKLPLLEDTTNNLIRYVDETKNHPGRKFSTGGYSLIPVVPGSPQADFKTRMDQIHGAGFLQAYNSLKGGGAGAITDIEGKKATEASNRMSAATSDAEFDAAAQDFKDILKQNLERARGQADQLQPATTKKDRPPLSSFQKD